jgi:hypothetical protein
MTESTRTGWAGHAAILTATRNAYNKLSLGNTKEINLIVRLGVNGAIISTPYTSSCCTETSYLYPAANKNPFPVQEFGSLIFTETENKTE